MDPCYLNNPCAINAVCFVAQHKAQCRCPAGMEGDPHIKCEAIKCQADDDCPQDRTCRDRKCVDPCVYTNCASNAICIPKNHLGVCQCLPGYDGEPTLRCVLKEPRDPPCTTDHECGIGLACIGDRCQKLCSTDFCGENAACRAVESVPFKTMVCECLPGYEGDAQTQCRPSKENTQLLHFSTYSIWILLYSGYTVMDHKCCSYNVTNCYLLLTLTNMDSLLVLDCINNTTLCFKVNN